MTIPPFLDWNGNTFRITREALHVFMANGTVDPASIIITDVHGHQANVQQIAAAMDGNEYGVITNAVIHGKSTAGGGAWVDVKVSPSGAVQVGGALDTIGTINAIGGTVTFNGNSRDVTIATGGTATNRVAGLAQRWSNIYTKGNSQFVVLTGTLNGASVAGGRAETFVRTSVSGSIAEHVTPQTDWAVTSGIDWAESQIFLMDFQSLRVGRIRFAVDANGTALELNSVRNDDQRITGYWQTANQPVYWRQYNTADYTYTELGYGDLNNAIGFRYRVPVDANQTMRAICATVKSEGGGNLSELTGIRFAASNGTTKKTVSTTLIPILSIQVKSTLNTYPVKAIVLPNDFELTNDNPIYYEWRVNPTLTGASFTSVDANSITNFDVTASAVTGGRVIRSGYFGSGAAGSRNSTTKALTSRIPLGVSWAGVGDILTLCAIRDGTTNSSVGAALNFEEIR